MIELEPLLEPGILRGMVATPEQIIIANFAAKNSILILDMWKEGDVVEDAVCPLLPDNS